MVKKLNLLIVSKFIMVLWLCSGCSSTETHQLSEKHTVQLNIGLFIPITSVISETELYTLTEEQQQKFLHFYQSKISTQYLPHEIIEQFLSSQLSNFTYYGKTYTAHEAMLKNTGNCMSLAILTTALSKIVGIDMDYRQMNSLPVYEKHGNVILSSSHVQSVLYDPTFVPDDELVYIRKPAVVIDYFPQEDNISSNTIINSTQFLSMYYVNKAAEFYIEQNFDHAFAYASQAYSLNIESISAMNLLALLHKKRGDEKTAEELYIAAMTSKDKNISVLDNYVSLLKSQGRLNRAKLVMQRLDNMYDPNPYHWLEKAQFARRKKEYKAAERYYRKVIKLAPYVKQAYVELYDIYLVQDKKLQAITTLQKSLPWIYEAKQKRKFKKQLYQLSQTI